MRMYIFTVHSFCFVSSTDATTLPQQQQQLQQSHEESYPITYSGEYERDPDEPPVDPERTVLDFFNSDLHLEISRDGLVVLNLPGLRV